MGGTYVLLVSACHFCDSENLVSFSLALWGPDHLSLLNQYFCRSLWYNISFGALVPFSFGPWMTPPITQQVTPLNKPVERSLALYSASRTHRNQNNPQGFLIHSISAWPKLHFTIVSIVRANPACKTVEKELFLSFPAVWHTVSWVTCCLLLLHKHSTFWCDTGLSFSCFFSYSVSLGNSSMPVESIS